MIAPATTTLTKFRRVQIRTRIQIAGIREPYAAQHAPNMGIATLVGAEIPPISPGVSLAHGVGTGANPIQGVEALGYTRFVYGVLDAVMVGWSVALWFVATGPLRRREPWAWNAVGASVATWFIIDSTLSIMSGYGENALLNLAFAVMLGAPLMAIRRDLHHHSAT